MRTTAQRLRVLLGAVALLCLLAPARSSVQGASGNVEVRFEETDPTRFPTVSTRVTVLDPNGIPIAGLTPQDFQVFEEGQPVPVTQVQPFVNPDVAIAVALAIDMSGSMYEEIAEAKSQAAAFVNGLSPSDSVAVIGFVGPPGSVNLDDPFPQINPEREIDFTTDKAAVLALIDSLSVPSRRAGETPLYDALFKAARMVARVKGVDYRFVIAFTDGNETCSGCGGSVLGPDDPIDEARKLALPVFTVGLGKDADEGYLKRVALNSGATYTFTPTPDKLAEIYQAIADQLKQQYVITFAAEAVADGKDHRLEVKVTTEVGEGSNVVSVTYPCPTKPGIRLFYLKPSAVAGQPPTQEPLQDGREATGLFTIVPDISACNPIARVEVLWDGQAQAPVETLPFHIVLDLLTVQQTAPGAHQVTLRAIDTAGVASDDLTVTLNVPGLAPTATEPITGTATVTPPPPPPPDGVPPWVWVVGGVALVALLLTAVLLLTRRRPRICPTCGRRMDPKWSECMFCASQMAGAAGLVTTPGLEPSTEPEQPALGFYGAGGAAAVPPAATVAPGGMPYAAVPPAAPAPAPLDRTEMMHHLPHRGGWLVMVQGDRQGTRYRLHEGDTSIGRAPSSDVVVSDATVSRQQAKVRLEPDGYYLYDLAATNPTLINGRPATRHRLVPGDRLQMGEVTLVFQETEMR